MKDDNPEFLNPINDDTPTQEEKTKDPSNGDYSVPLIPNDDDYQPTHKNNIVIQNKEPSNNDNIDNNIQDDEQTLKERSVVQNKNASKTLAGLSIILIIIIIIDIIFQITGEFNPYALGDDAAILILSIVFFYFVFKHKPFNNSELIVFTIFIWLAGAALRWYGVIQYKNSDISRIAIGLLVARTIILFLCIPLTCANLKKE